MNYETRPQQIEMTLEIQKAIEQNKHLIIEAGTGVGKSLAYLVPFIFWSIEEKKKVIISTYTKTLQEQLADKDLPFLQEILPVEFKFEMCVGSENYLCLRRLGNTFQYGLFDSPNEVKEINRISKWRERTQTGLRLELDFEPQERSWSKVCREPDMCLGNRCRYRNECFYSQSRIAQSKADLLVVNHHLFFANLSSGGRVLPAYDAVVFDEAQNIEDVAGEYLGAEVSNTGIKYLLDSIYNPKTRKGLITRIKGLKEETCNQVIEYVSAVRTVSDKFFTSILDEFGMGSLTKRLRTPNLFEDPIEEPLTGLYNILHSAITCLDNIEDITELNAYSDRCMAVCNNLKIFIEQSVENYVYWLEIISKPHYIKVCLNATPIDIAGLLREQVFNKTSPIILTSATLAVDGSFEYMKTRLGLDVPMELLLGSPFDYEKQVVLYIPDDLPDPSYETDKHTDCAIERTSEIIKITKGRAFVLFTSYSTLQQAYEYLSKNTEFEILKQGELPRWQMLNIFKMSENAVLLGTNTFWQGVDVPGQALECVVIFKLPFAVPDNPVTEAKMEFLAQKGKDPFINYQVPQAIIMLKQGFGRLIRTKTDHGIIAILDPRIKTRYYGKRFIESLPKCSLATTLSELKNFY